MARAAPRPGSVEEVDPDLLLADQALDAAVGALARRNQHHFEAMTEPERAQAVDTWRALATDVLGAVRATVATEGAEPVPTTSYGGRAVVIFEDAGGQDAGEQDVNVHAAFHPELQQADNGEIAGTPAQLTALALLEQLAPDEEQAEGDSA